MDRRVEIVQAKGMRGAAVRCLYDLYGSDAGATLRTLKNQLKYKGYVVEKDIRRAVAYLSGEGKAYVRIDVNEDEYWDSKVWLTPAGVNLVEGDLEDAGVILDE